MEGLVEALIEPFGKPSYQIASFFQNMVNLGELKAYSIEVNKKFVEKDTKDEELLRTIKGATLTPITKLKENLAVFVEDSKNGIRYNLRIECRGGTFYNDGDSQTIYNNCVLEKLASHLDLKKVDFSAFYNKILIPEEYVTASIITSYDENWESGSDYDYIASINRFLIVKGDKDKLFEKFYEFLRSN